MNTRNLMFLVVLLWSTANWPVYGQISEKSSSLHTATSPSSSIFNQLERDDMLEITIKTDLKGLLSGKGVEKYIPAELSYEDMSGQDVSWSIEARQRGKYRRRVCDFPPLKLRFDKKDLAQNGLSSFHTLKLVTHCMEDAYLSKTAVMKEYLAYQLYEELTDKSLKTQLVKVTYVDSKKRMLKIKRYGFIIENHHAMAARLDGAICDCINPNMETLQQQQEMITAVFQYMIGNEDWDISMGRNVKMVQPKNGASYAVPYDFDFSGLVNVSYAVPNQDLGLNSVTERAFQGYFKERGDIEAILDYFQVKKAALYQIIQNLKPLDNIGRKRAIRYLDEFFLEMDYYIMIGNDMPIEVSK